MQSALNQPRRGFSLFTGAHQTPSVLSPRLLSASRWAPIRLASDIRRAIPGRTVAKVTERCFAASQACAEVAVEFYGVPQAKIEVLPLGSDTGLFRPLESELQHQSRHRLRAELGFNDEDVVCIYTGRLTPGKDPLCLAQAVSALGPPFRGLFVGGGPQADTIASHQRCRVRPFVRWSDLPRWYRAADVGVWPRQESISMLDAAACGLPIVASDRMGALERIEGYGLTYEEGNPRDLAAVLRPLHDPRLRADLGLKAIHAIRTQFSWEAIADRRVARYEAAVRRRRTRAPG